MIALNSVELTEQLFQAIDAIVEERMRILPYDKTVIATIVNNESASVGKYQVTTDDNITFWAYSEITTYSLQEKVYVRIPQNDYTKQKIITGRYIQSDRFTPITEVKNNQMITLQTAVKNLESRITILEKQLREKGD